MFGPVDPDPSLKKGQKYLIGFVGLMGPQDGVDHTLRALAALKDRRSDWHAVFVGEGEIVDDMQRLSTDLGLDGMVDFPVVRETADYDTVDVRRLRCATRRPRSTTCRPWSSSSSTWRCRSRLWRTISVNLAGSRPRQLSTQRPTIRWRSRARSTNY